MTGIQHGPDLCISSIVCIMNFTNLRLIEKDYEILFDQKINCITLVDHKVRMIRLDIFFLLQIFHIYIFNI